MEEYLRDAKGQILESGFYFYDNPMFCNGYLCYIEVNENRKSFTVETALDGFLPITNFQLAAQNFIFLGRKDTTQVNINFVLNKLEKLSQKS